MNFCKVVYWYAAARCIDELMFTQSSESGARARCRNGGSAEPAGIVAAISLDQGGLKQAKLSTTVEIVEQRLNSLRF
jgi:hypothetical protein